MTKLAEHEARISALEKQVVGILGGQTGVTASTDGLEAEQSSTLNVPPKQEIHARGKVLWVRRADEDLALSNEEWDSMRAAEDNE